MKIGELVQRTRMFLVHGQWDGELTRFPPSRRLLRAWVRMLTLAVYRFFRDKCTLRAASLTLVLIFSLAPALAVGFSVAKGFGVQKQVPQMIYKQLGVDAEDLIDNPAGEQIKRMVDTILKYVADMNAETLGLVGFAIMLYTAYTVLASVEKTLNDIWGIRDRNAFIRRVVDYLAVLFVLPIMLIMALLLSAFLESPAMREYLCTHLPYFNTLDTTERDFVLPQWLFVGLGMSARLGFAAVGLGFLYHFFPNTRVRFKSAVVGGIIAALMWAALQFAFLKLQIGVAKYDKIYGTFAAVPIFMLWVYFSWWVVLFGAELSYAHAHHEQYEFGHLGGTATPACREEIALGIAAVVTRAFIREERPLGADAIAHAIHAPAHTVREVLEDLVVGRVLSRIHSDLPRYQPAAPLDQVSLARVREAVHGPNDAFPQLAAALNHMGLKDILAARSACDDQLNRLTLRDLATAIEKKSAKT